jgi:hypothetical protein
MGKAKNQKLKLQKKIKGVPYVTHGMAQQFEQMTDINDIDESNGVQGFDFFEAFKKLI